QPAVVDIRAEAVPQERRQTAVELDGRHRGTAVQEAGREQPEPRADLEDPGAWLRVGFGEDRLEHVDVREEVLRHRMSGAPAGVPERPADGGRIEPGRAHAW